MVDELRMFHVKRIERLSLVLTSFRMPCYAEYIEAFGQLTSAKDAQFAFEQTVRKYHRE